MKDDQGNKIKAKTMTRRQAIPYLERLRNHLSGDERCKKLEGKVYEKVGKKYIRALDLAITGLEQLVGPREVSKTGS